MEDNEKRVYETENNPIVLFLFFGVPLIIWIIQMIEGLVEVANSVIHYLGS